MTFKEDIFEICHEVAVEFPDWKLTSSGAFKNKSLKHTDLIVDPCFYFSPINSCAVDPKARIYNKKIAKLYKQFAGRDYPWTMAIKFALELSDYYGPQAITDIFAQRKEFVSGSNRQPIPWPCTWLALDQAKDYLRKTLTDGIGILNTHFDFSSEENLLRHLPTSYKVRDKGVHNTGRRGSFYEEHDGIMLCLAAIVVGDFEFVEHYASDDFKTQVAKRPELQAIVAALPELKRKFVETGKVV